MSKSITITSMPTALLHRKPATPLVHYSRLSTERNISFKSYIPPDSWDSHMHVVDPEKYPLAPSAAYIPRPHSVSQAMNFESTVGLSNIVLVQPSIYGNDNSCLLAALQELGPERARGVVAFDPNTIDQRTLKEWDDLGVRGVRINLKSVGREVNENELRAELKQYADVIRPLHWVLELFIGMESVPFLERLIPELNVTVCLAHFGAPTMPAVSESGSRKKITSPYSLPGFQALINLLQKDLVYVKLSAPYRFGKERDQRDLEPLAREMIKAAGHKRLVFATDWPHTRFDGLDIKPFFEQCIEWCDRDKALIERIFRGNAEELWGVERKRV